MKGFRPGGGLQQIMQQANQMQSKMKKLQEELATKCYAGAAGGGAVTVEVNGEYLLTSVKMTPDVFKDADTDLLQDMVLAATNEAIKAAKAHYQAEMGKVTGGIGLPGLF
jgi:DNA-binding YbaB/EbfC family protein